MWNKDLLERALEEFDPDGVPFPDIKDVPLMCEAYELHVALRDLVQLVEHNPAYRFARELFDAQTLLRRVQDASRN